MNIDPRPINVGAKYTKFHVDTPQEIRHELKRTKVFQRLTWCEDFTKYHYRSNRK